MPRAANPATLAGSTRLPSLPAAPKRGSEGPDPLVRGLETSRDSARSATLCPGSSAWSSYTPARIHAVSMHHRKQRGSSASRSTSAARLRPWRSGSERPTHPTLPTCPSNPSPASRQLRKHPSHPCNDSACGSLARSLPNLYPKFSSLIHISQPILRRLPKPDPTRCRPPPPLQTRHPSLASARSILASRATLAPTPDAYSITSSTARRTAGSSSGPRPTRMRICGNAPVPRSMARRGLSVGTSMG